MVRNWVETIANMKGTDYKPDCRQASSAPAGIELKKEFKRNITKG